MHVLSGCIRMVNEDVIDLYSRVNVGTKVVVLPDRQHQASGPAAVGQPSRAAEIEHHHANTLRAFESLLTSKSLNTAIPGPMVPNRPGSRAVGSLPRSRPQSFSE